MLVQSLVPHSQSLPIPRLNPHDTTLVSPEDIAWDNQTAYSADTMDVVGWNYCTFPPSPPASVCSNADDSPQLSRKAIRQRSTSETQSENEQQSCLPTRQVFELDAVEAPSSSSSASPPPSMPHQLTISSDNEPSLKRSFSMIGVKKGRGNGERITTKDFVPPDVSGLSKREARLLKNRAAAFLSRQRKREEFEAMEIRLRELEEENSRLQMLAAKGKKYDVLLANMEQLRLRLSVAEKRERELTVELANQTATNLTIKTESHDLNLPPSPYAPYTTTGQVSTITILKQSLLSSLPSLLALPSHTPLPISFSIPLTGTSPARLSSAPYGHQSTACDLKDQGRPRFGHEGVALHPNSIHAESSKNMVFSGEAPEVHQFDVDGVHFLGSLAISFDTSSTEDGRGCVRIGVSDRLAKSTIHGNRQKPPSLTSWTGSDPSFGMTCYTSPSLSTPVSMPSPGSIDHFGIFTGGNVNTHMGFDTQLMSSGYTPYAQHDQEPSFDYYPGMIPE